MPVVIEAFYPFLEVQTRNSNLIGKKVNAIKRQCCAGNSIERLLPDIVGI
ncbi:MAG: hypothetical protein Q8K12_08170 [Thiobacillus sp.]|nr:hypothetical protein [Thiobacillus sp.]